MPRTQQALFLCAWITLLSQFSSCGSTGCFPHWIDGLLDVVKFYVEEVGTPINEKMTVGDDNKPAGTVNIAHAACAYAESAIMDYALSKDPRLLNHADPSNRLPLQWCAFQGNADMVEAMLEHTTLRQLQHKDSSGNDAEGLSQMMLQQAIGTSRQFHLCARVPCDFSCSRLLVSRRDLLNVRRQLSNS
eukprot:COSAG02_NODE_4838_length_4920_cov_44.866210_3_plen_189_part_00